MTALTALSPEMRRFLIAGAANTALGYAVYLLLLGLVDYRLAYVGSFLFGVMTAYALQLRWVFQSSHSHGKVVFFLMSYAIQFLLGLAAVHISVEWLSAPRWMALLFSLLLTVPFAFFFNRRFMADVR